MKNTSFLSIFLISITVLTLLCGCQNNKGSTENKPTSNTTEDIKEAEIGTILDRPEKEFNGEQIYTLYLIPDPDDDSKINSMELILDDRKDPGVVYVSDGVIKLNETVYELYENDKFKIYKKDLFNSKFKKIEGLSEQELEDEKLGMFSLLYEYLGVGYTEINPDTKFKKCENDSSMFTGEAFVYTLITNDNENGELWVDKDTGIFVKLTDKSGNEIFKVQEIKTKNIDIPDYNGYRKSK